MNCCDFDCRQGRDCPVRAANSFPHVTGCSQKAPMTHTKQAPAAIESVAVDGTDHVLRLCQWLAVTAAAGALLACFVFFKR